jgi:uncharacterized protein (DUF2336 family)
MYFNARDSSVTTDATLTPADVQRLLTDPSSDNRALTAGKLGDTFSKGKLSDTERRMAEDIFRLMMRDLEVKVRKSLSDSIKLSPDLPRDVALAMANDVADIALPVIEASTVLTDDDLIRIISSKPTEYQVAVAARADVSEAVSEALVATDNETVVERLVSNDGAKIADTTLTKVLDKFGHIARIAHPMATRSVLPVSVAERLVNLVSERIRDHLVTHHNLSDDMAMDLVMASRERATLNLLSGDGDAPDVMELVEQLARNKRLTPSIILRALCMGDITFFEAAVARMAGIPVANAYQLIHDRGQTGLERLLAKAGMPAKMLPIIRGALAIAEELGFSFQEREKMQNLVMERVITQFEDGFEDMDYLIAKLSGRSYLPQPTI